MRGASILRNLIRHQQWKGFNEKTVVQPNFVHMIISGSIATFKKENVNCLGSDNLFWLTAVYVVT